MAAFFDEDDADAGTGSIAQPVGTAALGYKQNPALLNIY
jgi:hypothetical protein